MEGLGSYIEDTIVSHDGTQVYFSGIEGVTRFQRDPATGLLSFAELVEAPDQEGSMELSIDGTELYLASANSPGSVAVFEVAADGSLSLLEVERAGVVDPDDGAPRPEGLARAEDLTISPDGRYLYVASQADDAIAIFEREGAPVPAVAPLPPPAAAAPAADTKLIGGLVKAAKKQRQKGSQIVLKLTLKAGEKATGRGWGKVFVGKRAYKLKQLKRSLSPGKAVTLKLKPAKAKQRKRIVAALRRGKKVRAKLTGKIVDGAGNSLKKTRGVRLLPPK